MRATDRLEFTRQLTEAMSVYGTPLSRSMADAFWRSLERFPLAAVLEALQRHVDDPETGKYQPRPADLIRWMVERDGRPTTGEAWRIAQRAADEADSVAVTPEILAALAEVQPYLNSGNAWMADRMFHEAYAKQVREARARGLPVDWSMSFGTAPALRQSAVEEAVMLGRLSAEQAAPHLQRIAHETGQLPRPADSAVQLTGPILVPAISGEGGHQLCEKLRAGITTQEQRADANRAKVLASQADLEDRKRLAAQAVEAHGEGQPGPSSARPGSA
ncbi:hypothetical protein SA496_20195 [Pseudomonas sp. JS3066]|uniref:hypothetical protein n=1 Tax=Pseudomonas sp. JS3066 TaxID=3090665 RepID=UPI002E7C0E6C|nr:hypothetical protein [Pseudomonas sp. JS3066]WVK92023.1 hypothetical protein SA496_20195 [Pseudomonas sp. JS3066]